MNNYLLLITILFISMFLIIIIVDMFKRYTQDYLITYEVLDKNDNILNGRILRQHTGFFNRKISARELELLEIELIRDNDYKICTITNVIKLKSSFIKIEPLLTDFELKLLYYNPKRGPRLMK